MAKVDLKKGLKHLCNPSARAVSVEDVPPINFLMIDGSGDPNTSQEYAGVGEALYSLAYALKFKIKKKAGLDYAVMPLEGLWWVDEGVQFSTSNKEAWKWTAMIMQPEYVTAELFAETLAEVEKKKKLTALSKVRFEPYHEGLSAQIMHIGPHGEEEVPTVAKLHDFISQNGYKLRGKHHEIYLKDPRKTAPEKLQTVIRQPFE